MDDRRRTISSEEQMIGEALMRVSNTLEAQRLTKSLDYQEKLRRRSNIRLIIAIICLVMAFMMVVVGGALLFVLWRYADPVLDTVMPFLKGMFGDFGIIWDGLIESATYIPVMVEQLTRILESMCIMLEGISSIDIAGLMKHLSTMLGTMTGMIVGLGDAMDSMMPMLGTMGEALTAMVQGLAAGDLSVIGDMLSGLGLDGMMQALSSLMQSMTKMMGSIAEGMAAADFEALGDGTEKLINNMGLAVDAAAGQITAAQAAEIVGGLGNAMVGMVDGLEGIAGLLGRLGNLLT